MVVNPVCTFTSSFEAALHVPNGSWRLADSHVRRGDPETWSVVSFSSGGFARPGNVQESMRSSDHSRCAQLLRSFGSPLLSGTVVESRDFDAFGR